jgi:hypothetical protein
MVTLPPHLHVAARRVPGWRRQKLTRARRVFFEKPSLPVHERYLRSAQIHYITDRGGGNAVADGSRSAEAPNSLPGGVLTGSIENIFTH